MRADPPARPISDPRLRIVAVLMLAFSFSALHGPLPLGLMLAVTLALIWASGLRFAVLARRLKAPGLVVAGLVILLPLTSGDTILATLGPIALRAEGVAAAVGIALRFLCIFSLVLVFLGALPIPHLIAGLRGLGVPELLVDMALLTLRHIADLRADLMRMLVAMRLRGAAKGGAAWVWRGGLRATGWMLASLLLRSHARSERIYHAMILRGHGAPGAASPQTAPVSGADKAWLAVLTALAVALVLTEHLA